MSFHPSFRITMLPVQFSTILQVLLICQIYFKNLHVVVKQAKIVTQAVLHQLSFISGSLVCPILDARYGMHFLVSLLESRLKTDGHISSVVRWIYFIHGNFCTIQMICFCFQFKHEYLHEYLLKGTYGE